MAPGGLSLTTHTRQRVRLSMQWVRTRTGAGGTRCDVCEGSWPVNLSVPGGAERVQAVGADGRHVLDNLMHSRRLRVSPRAVKRPLSRYAYKSLRVDRRTYKATISIDILTIPLSP